MLSLTDIAAIKVAEFLVKHDRPNSLLRVRVVGGGCSGFQYQLALDDESRDGDQVIEKNGVKMLIDERSLPYLEGTEIDYVEDLMGAGFRFNNPNAVSSCGCGESFQV